MIRYERTATSIAAEQLKGFFEGWPQPPSPETHLRLLTNSDEVVLAIDEQTNQVVGFITALTDRVLAAYIPLLEVLPAYRQQGIGKELVRRLLAQLSGLYAIDVLCDPPLQPFYASLGLRPATGAMRRNYEHQAGAAVGSDANG
jgi:ribosomal protein S18 acetylase RimI-like enzyme